LAEQDLADPQTLISLLRAGEAPLEIRMFAARRLLPLDHNDQIRALLSVLEDADQGASSAAGESFVATPPEELSQFLQAGAPTSAELDRLARHVQDPIVLEQVIRHKNVADATLEALARTAGPGPQEALVVNQVRLLRQPSLIDALLENPQLTTDNRRRLLEVREEFFDKEERRRLAEQSRIEQEAAAEAAAKAEEEAALDLAKLSPEEASLVTGAPRVEDGLETSLATGAVYRRIAVMTVSEKIKLAYSGGKEERRILMGDANKLVGEAVLKSRGLTVNEVEGFAAMRYIHDDLLRRMAGNKEWMRHSGVITALVKNPKAPLAVTLPLVKRLPVRELRGIVRDPNLPEGVRLTARKWLDEKRR
jgi:hypothetical protein